MNKQKTTIKTSSKAKLPLPNDEVNENEVIVAVARYRELPAPIFKLHAIVIEDVFDYLSVADLNSIGQTCKRMNQLAGLYFQENVGTTGIEVMHNGLQISFLDITAFSKYVTSVSMDANTIEDFQFIESNCTSIKQLCVRGLNKNKFDCIKNTLAKVEFIDIGCFGIDDDFYDNFLKFCTNLKSLTLDSSVKGTNWLLKNYPRLEHVKLNRHFDRPLPELCTFLEKNPSIQRFSIAAKFLNNNSESFMTTTAILDELSVICFDFRDLKTIHTLLNKLYDRGFYKRFIIECSFIDLDHIELIAKIHGVEQLIYAFSINKIIWPVMLNLKKMKYNGFLCEDFGVETLVTNAINLESVDLKLATFNQILLLMSCSMHLKEIEVIFFPDRNFLDLFALNMARRKLYGAHKVIIYLDEMKYLATKWTFGNQEFDLVEIRRHIKTIY